MLTKENISSNLPVGDGKALREQHQQALLKLQFLEKAVNKKAAEIRQVTEDNERISEQISGLCGRIKGRLAGKETEVWLESTDKSDGLRLRSLELDL